MTTIRAKVKKYKEQFDEEIRKLEFCGDFHRLTDKNNSFYTLPFFLGYFSRQALKSSFEYVLFKDEFYAFQKRYIEHYVMQEVKEEISIEIGKVFITNG